MTLGVSAFPASFSQERLWFLEQLSPGNPSYNIATGLRIDMALDTISFENSINEIVRRHEALRTTFAADGDGHPVQVVARELRLRLPVVDLAEEDCMRLAEQEARRPFDLAHGPLLRTSLVRLKETEYILLLTMHHIISDGWSMGVFVDELVAIYHAFAAGLPSPLPELPIQYPDYSVWQRESLQGPALQTHLDFWSRRLAGLAPFELPADHPRPPVATHRGASRYIEVDDEITAACKALSQREGVTLFITLLTAFQVLLHRYSGQDDIVVGSPVAGRGQAELEGLIGFFVNTLVLRTDLSGRPTFREALSRVRETALSAYEHQDLPFEMLVASLRPERELNRHPLFQIAFQLFQESPDVAPAPAQSRHLRIEKSTAIFDLTLSLWEGGGRMRGRFEYSTDLFDSSTIERIADHFHTLLQGILADPDCSIARLPLMRPAEIKEEIAQVRAEIAVDCVHRLVEAQASARPNAVAVTCGAERLTYGELNHSANQLARYLCGLGVTPEQPVAVCLERSPALIVAALAVAKSGGVYLPLDPDYPPDRLAFMLSDSAACVVLTESRSAASLSQAIYAVPQATFLDAQRPEIEKQDGRNPNSGVTSHDAAYMIYTSGSTGRPKGVVIEHQGLSNLASWHRAAYDVTPDDRATVVGSPAFDASVWEIWPYLTAGASLHIPDEATRASPPALAAWIRRERITLSFLPTPLAELVLEESWPSDTALRVLLTGGDTLHRGPSPAIPFRLVNHYGPTEASVVTTCALVSPSGEPPPIGRPITNVQVYVLDELLQPVPVGVPGELYIGGLGLARGYWNDARLTAEKFVPHPFSLEPGARVFKSGDRVRSLPDGNLRFLGRLDAQTKIRGFRIEPGEIEAAIRRHPLVLEAVVAVRERDRLTAYYTSRQPVVDLMPFLRTLLPKYMTPSELVRLDKLPLLASGKVDRAALPVAEPQDSETFRPPRTALEDRLATLWAEVLDIDRVGIDDDFFELGGHSLLATRVASRLRAASGLELPLRFLFEAPTVAALAQRIETLEQASHAPAGVATSGREEGVL